MTVSSSLDSITIPYVTSLTSYAVTERFKTTARRKLTGQSGKD